ncbi:hypothetical protein PM082_005988 [Marasmius tenuissimus]|nr:hypothetical protein PM082_005988 [Marasmius tenuissimus]
MTNVDEASLPPVSLSETLKRKRSPQPEPTETSSKRAALRISIPEEPDRNDLGSASSLFSARTASSGSIESSIDILGQSDGNLVEEQPSPAYLLCPPIPGLFFNPSILLPETVADTVFRYCLETYFTAPDVNQVMLFGRAPSSPSSSAPEKTKQVGIPPPLHSLLSTLSELLHPCLPPNVHSLLFPPVPTRARQAIINLYNPGEGITSHVDLLRRFGDGIVGVSLSSGCVMQFARQRSEETVDGGTDERQSYETPSGYDLYLPERSILVMTEDARYKWTHGIPRRTRDYVESDTGGGWIDRKLRLSITFRWLLPGAEIVGGEGTENDFSSEEEV